MFEIKPSRASSLPQEVSLIRNTVGAWAGLFPAKAGPTKQQRVHSVGPASAGKLLILIVPLLCAGMHPVTLRVTLPGLNARRLRDAERQRRRYHAERGNDQTDSWCLR